MLTRPSWPPRIRSLREFVAWWCGSGGRFADLSTARPRAVAAGVAGETASSTDRTYSNPRGRRLDLHGGARLETSASRQQFRNFRKISGSPPDGRHVAPRNCRVQEISPSEFPESCSTIFSTRGGPHVSSFLRLQMRPVLLAGALALAGVCPPAAVAQTTGTVEGVVTDQSGAPLPSVGVELTSPNLQGTRTAVTAADGRYRLPSLPPGSYQVTAELIGFAKVQKNATVGLDATAQVDLSLSLAATVDVVVLGDAPLVDSASTTTGTNYSAKVIDKLPVGRNYAEIAFAQPGVQADFGETQRRSLAISIYGSTSAENLFLIDGINTTNVNKGFQGKDINSEFIQEVEVKAGGYQAEYGRNTGGVVNVTTKSGGNQCHGGVFGYYNDTGMRAEPVNALPENYDTPPYSETGDQQSFNGILSKVVRQEYGFDLGGFVVKDKVWFFGAYDRVQENGLVQPLDPNLPTFGNEYPGAPLQNEYAGKITLNLMSGTSVVGSVLSDAESRQGPMYVPLSNIPSTYAGRLDVGGPDYGARLNQLFGSYGIFTFQYAQHRDRWVIKPEGADRPGVIDATLNGSPTTEIPSDTPLYPP